MRIKKPHFSRREMGFALERAGAPLSVSVDQARAYGGGPSAPLYETADTANSGAFFKSLISVRFPRNWMEIQAKI
jgi:hypothetical protein